MARASMGGSILIAAALLGVPIIGSSYFVAQALERGATRLRVVVTALRSGSAPDRERPVQERRGDPTRGDEVVVGDAR